MRLRSDSGISHGHSLWVRVYPKNITRHLIRKHDLSLDWTAA